MIENLNFELNNLRVSSQRLGLKFNQMLLAIQDVRNIIEIENEEIITNNLTV